MPRICTTVDRELDSRIRAAARRRGLRIAALLREAIVHHLGRDGLDELWATIADLRATIADQEKMIARQAEQIAALERSASGGSTSARCGRA